MAKIRKSLKQRRYQPKFSIEEKIAASAPPASTRSQFDTAIEQQLVPYDENLLERTHTQWREGDWDSLVRLEMNVIEHHPDRAKLGLVVASAWLQQGDDAAARCYLRHALDWGCDKKLAAQILVAGVHNTLGRAAAIASDEARMEHNFRNAIAGSESQINHGRLGRRHSELHRLGLDQAGEWLTKTSRASLTAQDPPIIYPHRGITSYTQNYEDIRLWHSLWETENGFYIDVSTWDPVHDSFSKTFYEHGWRGFHVEPLPEYADKIRQDRPDEQVYQVLLGAEPGEKCFYFIPETGLSTACKEFAQRHLQVGWAIEERKYFVMTLTQLFDAVEGRQIHWLKIDAKGMEGDVLAGWCQHPARPWIILLGTTEPSGSIPTWMEWQHRLEARGYRFVYFDGLNRFYAHQAYENMVEQLNTPPNIFNQSTKRR